MGPPIQVAISIGAFQGLAFNGACSSALAMCSQCKAARHRPACLPALSRLLARIRCVPRRSLAASKYQVKVKWAHVKDQKLVHQFKSAIVQGVGTISVNETYQLQVDLDEVSSTPPDRSVGANAQDFVLHSPSTLAVVRSNRGDRLGAQGARPLGGACTMQRRGARYRGELD